MLAPPSTGLASFFHLLLLTTFARELESHKNGLAAFISKDSL